MSVDPWTIGLEMVNFLVLVWLLERLLYRPILAVIASRQAETDRVREADEAARAALAGEREEIERERERVATERARLLEEAHRQAREEQRRVEAAAREEALRLVAEGRARLEHEREEALRALEHKSVDLAVAIARRLLERSTPSHGDGRFVDAICEHLRAMDRSERARLIESLGDDGKARVVVAEALSSEREAQCRERLAEALGRPVSVEFLVDPSLIAGIEVHFPGLALRHSWRDALADGAQALLDDVADPARERDGRASR